MKILALWSKRGKRGVVNDELRSKKKKPHLVGKAKGKSISNNHTFEQANKRDTLNGSSPSVRSGHRPPESRLPGQSYHAWDTERVMRALDTTVKGLTAAEAAARVERDGKNLLTEGKKKNYFLLFLSEFKDFMLILLMAAAALSAGLAFMTGDKKELVDTFIISAIILINAGIGFVQGIRAEKAIAALRKLSAGHAHVWRDGVLVELLSSDLAVGDILELKEGDIVPADCRILEAVRLSADESSLTGEAHGVNKTAVTLSREDIALAERKNMLYSSTFLLKGSAKAVVTAVGMNTEVGHIAGSLATREKPKPTPLERGLSKLGRVVSVGVIIVAAVVYMIGAFLRGGDLTSNFMTAVALAVAAIPEGLTAVVTVIMAMGVTRMSKQKVIVRKLHSVETLGSVNCICSDKTGTMTENRMRVEKVWAFDNASGFEKMCACMGHCHSVKGTAGHYLGDPTEIALLEYLSSVSYSVPTGKTLDILPFDSDRKRMSVTVTLPGGVKTFTKGAAEVIAERCAFIVKNGQMMPMTAETRKEIAHAAELMARDALRVLSFAYTDGISPSEENLTFLGLCGMQDPPKKGVRDAVAACRQAGIRTVMITGDHADTAFAIGKSLNVVTDKRELVTGAELDRMGGEERKRRILNARIFARMEPRQKKEVVRVLQNAGFCVAMTGDGINDAPGLKAADIGIAMGIHGTEVTKNASDMVLSDDNFASIVTGVFEGRRIFDNIKKTVQFYLATNLCEVLSILFVTLFFGKLGFLISTQLLWINLITDSFPVLALGVEPAEKGLMRRAPVQAERALFSRQSVLSMLFYGVLQAAIVVGVYCGSIAAFGHETATTMAFFLLSFLELLHIFNVRSESGTAFCRAFFSNPTLLVTVALGVAVNLLPAVIAPLRDAFGLVALSAVQWSIVAACAIAILPLAEGYKLIVRLVSRRKRTENG